MYYIIYIYDYAVCYQPDSEAYPALFSSRADLFFQGFKGGRTISIRGRIANEFLPISPSPQKRVLPLQGHNSRGRNKLFLISLWVYSEGEYAPYSPWLDTPLANLQYKYLYMTHPNTIYNKRILTETRFSNPYYCNITRTNTFIDTQ